MNEIKTVSILEDAIEQTYSAEEFANLYKNAKIKNSAITLVKEPFIEEEFLVFEIEGQPWNNKFPLSINLFLNHGKDHPFPVYKCSKESLLSLRDYLNHCFKGKA